MAGDPEKRSKKPTQAQRIEALETRLAELTAWNDEQQSNLELLAASHNEMIGRYNSRQLEVNEHAELINKLKMERLAKDVVITQLVSLICTELGARPEGIHKLCENISTGVFSLSFEHLSPEESDRWISFLSRESEQQIANVAAQVAHYRERKASEDELDAGNEPIAVH